MASEESVLDTSYMPPELRLLKSRRVLRLFRSSMLFGLMAGAMILIWLIFSRAPYRDDLTTYIYQWSPLYALVSGVFFFGLSNPPATRNWSRAIALGCHLPRSKDRP